MRASFTMALCLVTLGCNTASLDSACTGAPCDDPGGGGDSKADDIDTDETVGNPSDETCPPGTDCGGCTLMPEYLSLGADDKQATLLELHEASRRADPDWSQNPLAALQAVKTFVFPSDGAHKIAGTLTRSCDVFEPQVKQVHALGAFAGAHLAIDENSPYTGLLAPGEVSAVIRFSIANPVIAQAPSWLPALEFIPGIGIKLLVDGSPSQNILAMNALAGQRNPDGSQNHNYFRDVFTNNFTYNAPPGSTADVKDRYDANHINRDVMTKVGQRFVEALELAGAPTDAPFHRPITNLAAVAPDGTEVQAPSSPDWLIFAASENVVANTAASNSSPATDFRDKLSALKAGEAVFDVFAVDCDFEGDTVQTLNATRMCAHGGPLVNVHGIDDRPGLYIGQLILDTVPSASSWADQEFFVQHPH